jgi:hypothetical protein
VKGEVGRIETGHTTCPIGRPRTTVSPIRGGEQ